MGDRKSTVKDQILHLLKMQGAQTASALAQQVQVSPMAIRQHLQALKAKALVFYEEERRPLGRPVKLWHLAEQSVYRFPDSHADLLLDVLCGVETLLGPEALHQVIADRSRRQIQAYQQKIADLGIGQTWQDRVRAIAQLRSQEGYMAEVIESSAEEMILVENHCPICAAATTCQRLCGAELEVFRHLLGTGVMVERVEHIVQGDRRCAYRIQPMVSDSSHPSPRSTPNTDEATA